jgi:nucleotide-binding universal stress UspA family protein
MELPVGMVRRRWVLGYDASAGSQAAVQWCVDHGVALDAEVIAVGVVDLIPMIGLPPPSSLAARLPFDELETAMRDEVERGVAPLRAAGLACRTIVQSGQPADVLERVAKEESGDLIVVGRRGRGGFAELLLGSVPQALAHHASRPLVIVPATT